MAARKSLHGAWLILQALRLNAFPFPAIFAAPVIIQALAHCEALTQGKWPVYIVPASIMNNKATSLNEVRTAEPGYCQYA